MQVVIGIDERYYEIIKNDVGSGCDFKPFKIIAEGTPLPKGHGDLIDRSKLDVTPIDITDLPIDRCLLVYMDEDVDNASALVCADKESEGKE